jgi:tRNA-dihydrouridine synthase C
MLVLAPMDGVTDHVFRELMTAIAPRPLGIDLCVTEFVRVTREVVTEAVLHREVPELTAGGRTSAGTPVFVQLLGSEPGPMAATAARLVELGALGIDLNYGCPAKTVNSSDGGATLLKDPCRIEAVTAAVRDAVPAHVPVTAKVRLGWDSADGVEEVARAAARGGAAWLTIHGRTRAQLYRPPVDRLAIARAAAAIDIPVIANGDLVCPEDVVACSVITGCSAFMIGRGAMADPTIFLRTKRRFRGEATATEASVVDVLTLAAIHARAMVDAGTTASQALGRTKQWLRMAAAIREDVAPYFDAIKGRLDLDDALAWIETAQGGGSRSPVWTIRRRSTHAI